MGAGLPKIASILGCTVPQAQTAVGNFLRSLPELNKLKSIKIPRDAARGYFIGLDGRKVKCDSEHLMLAGYLQNGESIIMKKATVLWTQKAMKRSIRFRLLDFVHDEWQTECPTEEEAHAIGKLKCEALEEVGEQLGMFCALEGKYVVGKNWRDTH